jgi:hypothetical protein
MTAPSPGDTEQWTIVQVASYLRMSYQDARNAMLEGVFGESFYEAKSRRLTVLASAVRAYRDARDAKRRKAPKKARKSR